MLERADQGSTGCIVSRDSKEVFCTSNSKVSTPRGVKHRNEIVDESEELELESELRSCSGCDIDYETDFERSRAEVRMSYVRGRIE
jgi:hypothetical protein